MVMTDVPSYVAGITGMSEITVQLLLSVLIITILLFPYLILAKDKSNGFVIIILIFIGESISLSLGWSPFWLMLMFMVILSASVAILGTKGVTGNGG